MFGSDSINQTFGRSIFNYNTPILINSNHHNDVDELGYHTHDFFELVYIIDGSALHKTPTQTNEISQGDYFIININTPHKYVGEVTVLNCLFYPEFIDKALAKHTNFNDLLNSYLIKFHFNDFSYSPAEKIFHDSDGAVLNFLHLIKNELNNALPGCFEVIRCLLIQLIIHTLRSIYSYSSTKKSKIIEECLYEIEHNFSNDFHLNHFCEKHHYDPSYLSRKFKKEVGISYIKYIHNIRIHEACHMLTNTDLKVSEIATAVGFSDMKHFFQIFKTIVGMTPTEYKKQYN